MYKWYRNYFWKHGKPYGVEICNNPASETCYKIVADPYYKRISIEEYSQGSFVRIIYDSALFDFRKLKVEEQTAWQKMIVHETEKMIESHIRDHDDRLIMIEKCDFENQICRSCKTYSALGVLLTIQNICYVDLNDPFNGVILFDQTMRMIMCKRYSLSSETGLFDEVLEECHDMSLSPKFLKANF